MDRFSFTSIVPTIIQGFKIEMDGFQILSQVKDDSISQGTTLQLYFYGCYKVMCIKLSRYFKFKKIIIPHTVFLRWEYSNRGYIIKTFSNSLPIQQFDCRLTQRKEEILSKNSVSHNKSKTPINKTSFIQQKGSITFDVREYKISG